MKSPVQDVHFSVCKLAMRYQSIDAYRLYGELSTEETRRAEALSSFLTHYLEGKSVISAETAVDILLQMNDVDRALKLLRICIANGHQSAIVKMLKLRRCDKKDIFFWGSLAKKFNFLPTKIQIPSRLRAHFGENYTTGNKFRELAVRVNSDVGQFLEYTYRLVQHQDICELKTIEKKRLSAARLCEYMENQDSSSLVFPSSNRTSYVLQAFHYASPVFKERNLNLVRSHLAALQRHERCGIVESQLYRSKMLSRNPDDMVRCGFILCLIGDLNSALSLFQKAANAGSLAGSEMAGYLMIHYQRDIENGLYFLAQCVSNPVAQIHQYMYTKDELYIRRASVLLKAPIKSSKMYEMVGDLFADGIKYPIMSKAAKAFYGYGIEMCDLYGEDARVLMQKVNYV